MEGLKIVAKVDVSEDKPPVKKDLEKNFDDSSSIKIVTSSDEKEVVDKVGNYCREMRMAADQ